MLVGVLFVIPCAAAVTAQVQSVGRTRHHRAIACQHLVTVNHLLNLGTLDEIVVQFTPIGLPAISLVRSPSHIPVRRPCGVEEDAVALVAHHPGHGAVVGTQDVLAAHSGTRPATKFDIQMYALSAQVEVVHAFAQSEEVFVGAQFARGLGAEAFGSKPTVGLLVEHLARSSIKHPDSPGAVTNLQGQCLGQKRSTLGKRLHFVRHRIKIVLHHHPLFVRKECRAGTLRDAQHVRCADLHAHIASF